MPEISQYKAKWKSIEHCVAMNPAVYVLLHMVIARQALHRNVNATCTSDFNGAAVKEAHNLKDA